MWQEHKPHHMQRYMQQNPYRLLALSFLAVMTVGTLLLMLPIASTQGQGTALVDAAFTAVSCFRRRRSRWDGGSSPCNEKINYLYISH